MGVAQPSEINAAFADGFNRRDVEALLALYQPDGAVVEIDGTVSHGIDPIRDHLERLVAIGGTMTSTNLTTVIVGDIALVTAAWEIVGACRRAVDHAAAAPRSCAAAPTARGRT